jgi:CBS domain-containing protein
MPIRPVRSIIAGQTPITASRNSTALEAASLMKQHGKGALLVVDGTHLIGIVTERDIVFRVVAMGRDPAGTRLGEVMTPQPQTIHPNEPFLRALRIMHQGGFRHLPVVENDWPLGVVSSRDALEDDLSQLLADLAQRGDERD